MIVIIPGLVLQVVLGQNSAMFYDNFKTLNSLTQLVCIVWIVLALSAGLALDG